MLYTQLYGDITEPWNNILSLAHQDFLEGHLRVFFPLLKSRNGWVFIATHQVDWFTIDVCCAYEFHIHIYTNIAMEDGPILKICIFV